MAEPEVEEVPIEEEYEQDAAAQLVNDALAGPLEQEPHLIMLRWSKSIGNLVAAMAQAACEYGEIVKESENPFFRNSASGGKYADLAALIGATRKQLGKYGVYVFQFPNINPRGKLTMLTFITHKSNEWMLHMMDDLPIAKPDIHGVGSGITYARRYTYGPALNIAAEDDDGNAAVASRKEHLAKVDEQLRGQERITPPQAKAFLETALKTKTKEQIEKYLDQLNGYKQAEEIQKRQYNDAIKWAVAREAKPKPEQTDMTHILGQSVDVAPLHRELRAAMQKHDVSNRGMHEFIQEQYHAESTKDLSEEQLKQTIHWVDQQ